MAGQKRSANIRWGKTPVTATSLALGQSEYLGSSTIVSSLALDRARLMMASAHNDYEATKLFLASETRLGYALTSYPFFFHAIFACLIPSFSTFSPTS